MEDMKLTKNQQLVFSTLQRFGAPLSAYEILDRVRNKGLRAPLQIYRALEKLMAIGTVHRLESLNAFVVCRHEGCAPDTVCAFEICDKCGKVSEFADAKISNHVKARAELDGFRLSKTTIELRGSCNACATG